MSSHARDDIRRINSGYSEPEEPDSDLLTVHEVARHLRVDDTTVRRWIKSGALDAITLPHRGKRQGYRVRKKTIENLFNQSSAGA